MLAALAFRFAGQYQIGRLRRFREEMLAVLKGVALLALFAMATVFFLQERYESRLTMLLFGVLTATGILVARRAGWAAVRSLRARLQPDDVAHRRHRPRRPAAERGRWGGWAGWASATSASSRTASGRTPPTSTVLGGFDDLPELIKQHRISHVFIALPFSRYEDVRRVFSILSQTLVEVRLVPDVPSLAGLSLTTTDLDGLPLVGPARESALRAERVHQARDGRGAGGGRRCCCCRR